MSNPSEPVGDREPKNTSSDTAQVSKDGDRQALMGLILEPHLRHAISASHYAGHVLGSDRKALNIPALVDHLRSTTDRTEAGELEVASGLLTAQAITLDSMFTELARRAAHNMGEYMDATERYGRLALKAQANCRATLEALAKLHQPREQTVRHVHVNEGGQAIVADKLNYNGGGSQNGNSDEQSHATGSTSQHAALPCPDAQWQGMPIAGGERAEAMQDARRDKPRRT